MPIKAQEDEGMDPSVYDNESEDTETESEGEDDSQTLISKEILPDGCKPGDTYTFKVVSDYGDEVGVKLVEKEDETDEDETKSEEDSEIESMDEEGED